MRYKQDLAKFLSIADGARLIQERAGITEDEAREDIVLVLRDGEAYFQFWRLGRDGRIWCHPRYLPHGFLNNLTSDDIDWETSIARRRRVGSPFTVEIEVKREDLSKLYPPLDDDGDREGSTIGAMPGTQQTSHETILNLTPKDSSKEEKPRSKRKRDAAADAISKCRYEKVLAQARSKYGGNRHSTKWMADELVKADKKRDAKHSDKLDLGAETVRKILGGTYKPATRLGVGCF